MRKRFQNKVAESRLSLPVVGTYAALLWAAVGLLLLDVGELWAQFVCFVVSAYLMVELNNTNALIRIYSRMVSCSFIMLTCMVAGTFDSKGGGIIELCFIATYTMLLRCYQDRNAAGWAYYAFLCMGLGSLVNIYIIYYVPLLWALMAFRLQCLSLRTYAASLLGMLTPYWVAAVYVFYEGDADMALGHFLPLTHYAMPLDFTGVPLGEAMAFGFVALLAIVGAAHYLYTSYNDKIRIRMFYDCFIVMVVATVAFFLLQPAQHNMLLRVLTVNASILFAHFAALSHSRLSNATFVAALVATLLLTALNLWMPSLLSL